jgi:hypothetical protein
VVGDGGAAIPAEVVEVDLAVGPAPHMVRHQAVVVEHPLAAEFQNGFVVEVEDATRVFDVEVNVSRQP